jgi:DNA-binding MarR family transcriptional regulator
MSGPLDGFDEVVHAPRRLAICAFLTTVDEAEFATIRERLEISDSSLSKQIKLLADVGYVSSRKSALRGRSRVWVGLTDAGREAFADHVERLRRVLSSAEN